jgi:hypothetical protein
VFGIARNLLARSIRRGRVEDETRRRLGLAPVVVDDEALAVINALDVSGSPAVEALDGLSGLLREAVAGHVVEEREYRELLPRPQWLAHIAVSEPSANICAPLVRPLVLANLGTPPA